MKYLKVLLVVALMVCMAVPAMAGRRGCRSSNEVYIEDPRLEAGLGLDLVLFEADNLHTVEWQNKLDLNNNDITGNTDDWSSKGFSTYLVYEFNLFKWLAKK